MRLILTDGATAVSCSVFEGMSVAELLSMLATRAKRRSGDRRLDHCWFAIMTDGRQVRSTRGGLWNALGDETDEYREFCMEAQTDVGFPDSDRS